MAAPEVEKHIQNSRVTFCRKEAGCPKDPCIEYLPTLGEKWPHSRGNVGKYTIHGSFVGGSVNLSETASTKTLERFE